MISLPDEALDGSGGNGLGQPGAGPPSIRPALPSVAAALPPAASPINFRRSITLPQPYGNPFVCCTKNISLPGSQVNFAARISRATHSAICQVVLTPTDYSCPCGRKCRD